MINVYRKEGHRREEFLGVWPSTAEGRAASDKFVNDHNTSAENPPAYEVYSRETPDAPPAAPAA